MGNNSDDNFRRQYLVDLCVGRLLANNQANNPADILSEYSQPPWHHVQPEPGDRNPNLFSYYLGGIAVLSSRYRQFRDTSIARSRRSASDDTSQQIPYHGGVSLSPASRLSASYQPVAFRPNRHRRTKYRRPKSRRAKC